MELTSTSYRVLSLLPFQHTVILISSEAEWDDIKADLESSSENWLAGGAACVRNRESSSIVCINPTGELHTFVGYIAHEATHVFQNLCIQACEPDPSHEFEAYYIGYITGWLLQETILEFMENQEI